MDGVMVTAALPLVFGCTVDPAGGWWSVAGPFGVDLGAGTREAAEDPCFGESGGSLLGDIQGWGRKDLTSHATVSDRLNSSNCGVARRPVLWT